MIKKKSQIAGMWSQIYNKLKSPPPGINLGSFPSRLPPQNQVTFDTTPGEAGGSAIAYVSSGDVNNDGKIDKIHIVVPKLEQQLRSMGIEPSNISDTNNLARLLTAFVDVLSHEMGHMKDFSPQGSAPFPGGESVADTAARQAVEQISVDATNISNRFEKLSLLSRRTKMLDKIKTLTALANDLDTKGMHKLADDVDQIIEDLRSGKMPQTQLQRDLIEEVEKRHDVETPKSSIKALQLRLGAPVSGLWDGDTQAAWGSFIDDNVDAILKMGQAPTLSEVNYESIIKELKFSWQSAASKFGQKPTLQGMMDFIDIVNKAKEQRKMMAVEKPEVEESATRTFMGADSAAKPDGSPGGTFDYSRKGINPEASNESDDIKKEASDKLSLEQILNSSFSTSNQNPFNR